MKLKITSGRLSDVVGPETGKVDWSELRSRLRELQPGRSLTVECPVEVPIQRLRSTILISARRIRYENGSWKVKTRVNGRKVFCFLVPVV